MECGLTLKSNRENAYLQTKQIIMANSRLKEFFQLGELGNYFVRVFQKPDPNKKSNFNLRMMHGINKISILMFLAAILIWIAKRLF